MPRVLVVGMSVIVVFLSSTAMAQSQETSIANVALVPSTIEYIPPLAQAVLHGDQKQVSEVIKEAPDSINEPVRSRKGSRSGYTPLILAAALSEPKIASILIQGGAKVTALDDYNRSAVWYAAFVGDAEVTKVLFEAPAISDVVNAADNDFRRTPLHLALRNNNSKLVSLLLKAGASTAPRDVLGETPLDYCKHAQTASCKALQ
jgi:ankyrin repeat protein